MSAHTEVSLTTRYHVIQPPHEESLHYDCMNPWCEFAPLITILQSFKRNFALKIGSHAQNLQNQKVDWQQFPMNLIHRTENWFPKISEISRPGKINMSKTGFHCWKSKICDWPSQKSHLRIKISFSNGSLTAKLTWNFPLLPCNMFATKTFKWTHVKVENFQLIPLHWKLH